MKIEAAIEFQRSPLISSLQEVPPLDFAFTNRPLIKTNITGNYLPKELNGMTFNLNQLTVQVAGTHLKLRKTPLLFT